MAKNTKSPRARIIWNRSDNPSRFVSDTLGIERWQLREADHIINHQSAERPRSTTPTVIYSDGRVTDADGEEIGNILGEVAGT